MGYKYLLSAAHTVTALLVYRHGVGGGSMTMIFITMGPILMREGEGGLTEEGGRRGWGWAGIGQRGHVQVGGGVGPWFC